MPHGSTGLPLLHTLLPGELSVAPGLVMDVNTPKDGIEIHKIPWDTIIYIYIYTYVYIVYIVYIVYVYTIYNIYIYNI